MPKDVPGVMREFKHGELHSGSSNGPVVKNRKQAVAIAMSERRQLQQNHHGAKHHSHHAVRPGHSFKGRRG